MMGIITDAQLRELLSLDRIAVVGPPETEQRAAREACVYFREQGYEVFGVALDGTDASDWQRYGSIAAIDEPVDIVNVHAESEVDEIVEAVIARGDVSVLWLEFEGTGEAAMERARDAGLIVVQNRDITVEHRRVFG